MLDLIKTNPSITRLVWPWYCAQPVNSDDIQRIVAEHSILIELDLLEHQFTAHDAIALIRQINSLKMFRFRLHHSEHTYLKTQVNDEWKVAYNGSRYEQTGILTLTVKGNRIMSMDKNLSS